MVNVNVNPYQLTSPNQHDDINVSVKTTIRTQLEQHTPITPTCQKQPVCQ